MFADTSVGAAFWHPWLSRPRPNIRMTLPSIIGRVAEVDWTSVISSRIRRGSVWVLFCLSNEAMGFGAVVELVI